MGLLGTQKERVKEILEALEACGGKISHAARLIGCSHNTIYDYMDIFPEIAVARKKFSNRYRDLRVETAEEVVEKLLKLTDSDPSLAGKQANFVLKYDKESHYHDSQTDKTKEDKVDEFIENLGKYVDATTRTS